MLALAAVLGGTGTAPGGAARAQVDGEARTFAVTDTRDAGPLDLRRLEATGASPGGRALRVMVRTWRSWDPRLLTRGTLHRLGVLLDVNGDGKTDCAGRVVFEGGALALYIEGAGRVFEPLRMRRTDATTVTVTLPGDEPPNPSAQRVRIAAQSLYVKRGTACDPGCADRIPDSGWLQTPLYWMFPDSRTTR